MKIQSVLFASLMCFSLCIFTGSVGAVEKGNPQIEEEKKDTPDKSDSFYEKIKSSIGIVNNDAEENQSQNILAKILSSLLVKQEGIERDLSEARQLEQNLYRYKELVVNEIKDLDTIFIGSPDIEKDFLGVKERLKKAELLLKNKNNNEELKSLLQEDLAPVFEQIRDKLKANRISIEEIFIDYSASKEVFPDLRNELNGFFNARKNDINKVKDAVKLFNKDLNECYSITRKISPEDPNLSGLLNHCSSEIKQLDLSKQGENEKILRDYMDTLTVEVEGRLASVRDKIANFEEQDIQLKQEIFESKEQIHKLEMAQLKRDNGRTQVSGEERELIGVASIWFGIIILSVIVAMVIIVKIRKNSRNDSFNYPLFLELITVFILAMIVLILGIANKIDSQAIAALIGGIAGYVLGKLDSNPSNMCRYSEFSQSGLPHPPTPKDHPPTPKDSK